MQISEIRQIAEWMRAEGLLVIEYRTPRVHLRLKCAVTECGLGRSMENAQVAADAGRVVASDTDGIFLTRHPTCATDFVAPGVIVAAGAVLALLRTGPLLLPVLAPEGGVVADTLAVNGTSVRTGAPLFRLVPTKPADSTGA